MRSGEATPMIVLADSPEQELQALKVGARMAALVNNASRWESETWEFGSLRIRSLQVKRYSRGGYEVLFSKWLCNGRTIGYNALLGKMREELK